ncbi:MAG: c-type cytochrome biogenesis protein CcsB [Firmicutes bacterium]|nr:c-type cytochrome biogenesis protein CcsB [Bacillota bacterium]
MSGYIPVSATAIFWENTFFNIASALYILAMFFYLTHLFGRKQLGSFASIVLRIAFLVHSVFLIMRTINLQRVPFVGPYEFGNMFIWATALVYLWTEWRLKDKYFAVGAFLTPLITLYIVYLTVVPRLIPAVRISRLHQQLRPVLQSPWLKIHVSASIFGYAGFTLAFAAAIMWLVKNKAGEQGVLAHTLPQKNILEEYMYRAAGFGFLFQSIMIITGAIWADTSWGSYWRWDPKEMWSLITWFVYAVYLHARFTQGWTGLRTVALVMVGWVAMLFTWVGVAWLLTGIHSFG